MALALSIVSASLIRKEWRQMNEDVSETSVRYAYQLILGRPPENDTVIQHHIRECRDISQLRQRFLSSAEFKLGFGKSQGSASPASTAPSLRSPKIEIETDALPEQMASMIRHIEANWAILGTNDPHWSVLTGEKFRKEVIGENIDAFYQSGQNSMEIFLATLDRAKVRPENLHTCFELGCGVGRVTVALAKHFEQVIAGDISTPHLRLASEVARERSITNIDFRLINKIDCFDDLPEFDAFYSVIVLQHNPPPVIAFLLKRILNKIAPGGIAYFQVPTYRIGGKFSVSEYLANAKTSGSMEVHALPQATLWQIVDECGCRPLDVREDSSVGSPAYLSNSILLQKRSGNASQSVDSM